MEPLDCHLEGRAELQGIKYKDYRVWMPSSLDLVPSPGPRIPVNSQKLQRGQSPLSGLFFFSHFSSVDSVHSFDNYNIKSFKDSSNKN